jgi:hypothetical protein
MNIEQGIPNFEVGHSIFDIRYSIFFLQTLGTLAHFRHFIRRGGFSSLE